MPKAIPMCQPGWLSGGRLSQVREEAQETVLVDREAYFMLRECWKMGLAED